MGAKPNPNRLPSLASRAAWRFSLSWVITCCGNGTSTGDPNRIWFTATNPSTGTSEQHDHHTGAAPVAVEERAEPEQTERQRRRQPRRQAHGEREGGERGGLDEVPGGRSVVPAQDQVESDHAHRRAPQLGLVVDAGASAQVHDRGGEGGQGGRRREPPGPPDRSTRHQAAGTGEQTGGPHPEQADGDELAGDREPTVEAVAPHHEGHADQRRADPEVDLGPAVDDEALEPDDLRGHVDVPLEQGPGLGVVEVGRVGAPIEQVSRGAPGGRQQEHDHGHDGADRGPPVARPG